ncbi:MAG TPA: hypothetical protein DHU75_03045 [Rikenellaceae bacterium]|nr:hypothetical protein [Rikenellaceae bacterium]
MARKTPNIELPPEKERIVDQKKRLPDFSMKSEAALIEQLFKEQNEQQAQSDAEIEEMMNAKTNIHKARPGEE